MFSCLLIFILYLLAFKLNNGRIYDTTKSGNHRNRHDHTRRP